MDSNRFGLAQHTTRAAVALTVIAVVAAFVGIRRVDAGASILVQILFFGVLMLAVAVLLTRPWARTS